MRDKEREQDIINLYLKGLKFREIGEKYGITKQRVWQILKFANGEYDSRNKKVRKIPHPNPSENFVFGKLATLGYKFEPMPYNHPFDAIVEGKKVEIKYRSRTRRIGRDRILAYSFNDVKDTVPIDFYIFVCGDLNYNPKCYIYPSNEIGRNKFFPIEFIYKASERKYLRHLENWELLKQI